MAERWATCLTCGGDLTDGEQLLRCRTHFVASIRLADDKLLVAEADLRDARDQRDEYHRRMTQAEARLAAVLDGIPRACSYCGEELGVGADRDAHMRACSQHPMGALLAEVEALREVATAARPFRGNWDPSLSKAFGKLDALKEVPHV